MTESIENLIPLNTSNLENNDFESACLREFSFEPRSIFVDVLVTCIMTFSVFYFILEVNEIANYERLSQNKITNNTIEVLYLLIAVIAIVIHLVKYYADYNKFFQIDFDNYPMLIVMILCALADVSYYCFNFIVIITKEHDSTRAIATISEALFSISILPFVIICVCNNVRPNEFIMEIRTKITILLAMGGCLVIYMRRVTVKVERDYFNNTQTTVNETDWNFIFRKADGADNILELLDITYILICLIFLVDPLRIVSKLKHGNEDENLKSEVNNSKLKFIERISFVRYRLLTIVFSVIVVLLLIIGSYIITQILVSGIDGAMIQNAKIIFQSCNIVVYISGIIFEIYYYYGDIRHWKLKDNFNIRNDENFNDFSALMQIVYACGMILSFIYITKDNKSLISIEILHFLFMAIQIIIQYGCINLAIRRQARRNKYNSWQSIIFPSIALASINFGFMVISIIYSQNTIFTEYLKLEHFALFYTIKDIALPVTILNRLHGMVFFINLSIQQWDN